MEVPAFKIPEPTDWANSLIHYFHKKFKTERFDEDARMFHELRVRATPTLERTSDRAHFFSRMFKRSTQTLRCSEEAIIEYLAQLAHLRRKINEQDVKIEFVWSDPVSRKKLRTSSWESECVHFLFNLGVLLAQKGAEQNLQTVEGIKLAFEYFRRSANIFNTLESEFADQAKEYKALMLAQAQFCFWLRANQSLCTKSVLAKICQQLGNLYSEAKRMDQANCYWSQAQVFQAAIDHEGGAYGCELARLDWALAHLPKGEKKFLNEVKGRVSVCERENRLIYHQDVPDFSSLGPIQSTMCVKIEPFSIDLDNFKSIFHELTSPEIILAESDYRVLCDQFLQVYFALVENLTINITNTLEKLGLPAKINGIQIIRGTLPDSIIDRNFRIQANGGSLALLQRIERIENVSTRCLSLLDPNHSYKEQALVNALMSGKKINQEIRNNFERNRLFIDNLGAPLIELQKTVDQYNTNNSPLSQSIVEQKTIIEHMLRELEKHIDQYQRVREELKTHALQDNILPKLIDQNPSSFHTIFQEHLQERYGKYLSQINSMGTETERLLAQVEESVKKFDTLAQTRDPPNSPKLTEMFQNFDIAFNAYLQIANALDEGIAFHEKIEISVMNVISSP